MKATGACPVRRVLVVEDDEAIRDNIAELLTEVGYAVACAADGCEGLRRLREQPSDLVLLDLMMPGMDGWSFRTAQLEDPHLAHIPVVVVSAFEHPRDIDAAAFVPKPYDVEHLLHVIERCILPA